MTDKLTIETDGEAADILCSMGLGSKGLRRLASNAGVSRRRGDTLRRTAERIVAQDPALAARMIENDREMEMDASAFRERREVGEGDISLDEAIARARHPRMGHKLRSLKSAVAGLPDYCVEVEWEYNGPGGLTSIVVCAREDRRMSPLVEGRAHLILTAHGGLRTFGAGDIGSIDYAKKYDKPRRAWSLGLSRIERFYNASLR